MPRRVSAALLLLSLGVLTGAAGGLEERFEAETPDWRKTLKTIRNGIHKIDTYLNFALDLIGGSDGLCRYQCSDGYKPIPRHGYKPSPPNGCGSPLFGFQFDIGIPSMTRCCNQHDRCYDTCGEEKRDCDEQFQVCLEVICRNVQMTLGLDHSVQGRVEKDSDSTRTAPSGHTQNLTETDAVIRSALNLDPDEEYKMDHKRRGRALIFNQEHFYWQLRLNSRSGTNADKRNLEQRFRELGFDVEAHDDKKREEIMRIITEAAGSNHADADCFVCVFLSHGENGHVYANDDKIDIQEMTSLFRGDKCPSLVGKPKIFILQACRGDKHDDPVAPMDVVDSEINQVVVDAGVVYTLPAGADFIMCYSVAEGFYSHRETVNGSWYIQDLCDILRRHGSQLEFVELLTLVNRKVSYRSVGNCTDRSAIGKKQVPCFASMLTKKLYFRPKKSQYV